jgi:hypothetical protein
MVWNTIPIAFVEGHYSLPFTGFLPISISYPTLDVKKRGSRKRDENVQLWREIGARKCDIHAAFVIVAKDSGRFFRNLVICAVSGDADSARQAVPSGHARLCALRCTMKKRDPQKTYPRTLLDDGIHPSGVC